MESELGVGSKFFFTFMISESKILSESLDPDDIELSLSVNPCDHVMQNLENQN